MAIEKRNNKSMDFEWINNIWPGVDWVLIGADWVSIEIGESTPVIY